MSLPAFLQYGQVSIYGIGSNTAQTSIVLPDGFLSGTIDAVSQYDILWAQPGYAVIFPDAEVTARLQYPPDNTAYTLIQEVRLVCRELPVP